MLFFYYNRQLIAEFIKLGIIVTHEHAIICYRTFRNEPGGRKMTLEEEDLLANGRNYEHSRGL